MSNACHIFALFAKVCLAGHRTPCQATKTPRCGSGNRPALMSRARKEAWCHAGRRLPACCQSMAGNSARHGTKPTDVNEPRPEGSGHTDRRIPSNPNRQPTAVTYSHLRMYPTPAYAGVLLTFPLPRPAVRRRCAPGHERVKALRLGWGWKLSGGWAANSAAPPPATCLCPFGALPDFAQI